jgi:hypothetical protein
MMSPDIVISVGVKVFPLSAVVNFTTLLPDALAAQIATVLFDTEPVTVNLSPYRRAVPV